MVVAVVSAEVAEVAVVTVEVALLQSAATASDLTTARAAMTATLCLKTGARPLAPWSVDSSVKAG